jgi:hypothetical protein
VADFNFVELKTTLTYNSIKSPVQGKLLEKSEKMLDIVRLPFS